MNKNCGNITLDMEEVKNHLIDDHNFIYLEVDCDGGGVKVGNDDFNFSIPNGSGDGRVCVLVDENIGPPRLKSLSGADFKFNGVIRVNDGTFGIYNYDSCGGKIIYEFKKGRYAAHIKENIIVFERWD